MILHDGSTWGSDTFGPILHEPGVITMIQFLTLMLNARRDEEKGATAVEYGLMVALIAVAIIATVTLLGSEPRPRCSTPIAGVHLISAPHMRQAGVASARRRPSHVSLPHTEGTSRLPARRPHATSAAATAVEYALMVDCLHRGDASSSATVNGLFGTSPSARATLRPNASPLRRTHLSRSPSQLDPRWPGLVGSPAPAPLHSHRRARVAVPLRIHVSPCRPAGDPAWGSKQVQPGRTATASRT